MSSSKPNWFTRYPIEQDDDGYDIHTVKEMADGYKLVICGSPDPDPESFFIFTPAWQSGANFPGVQKSSKVPKIMLGYNGTHSTLFVMNFQSF
jgi:hypothetical protein